MARTKAELQREIRLLRTRVKDMEQLLQQAAIKVEQLQGAYDATIATDKTVRANLQKFEVPPISQRENHLRSPSLPCSIPEQRIVRQRSRQ